jgi:GNAT superfamily N-acetyltransferase
MTTELPARLRAAEPGDATALAGTHLQAWAESYAGLLSAGYLAGMQLGPRQEFWQQVLADPAARTLLMDAGPVGIVGFASTRPGRPEDPRQLELWGIYLLAGWQRRGLGAALLAGVTQDRRCFLWVAQANRSAQDFYRQHDFALDGATQSLRWMEQLPVVRMVR